jgi:hypothetical protein
MNKTLVPCRFCAASGNEIDPSNLGFNEEERKSNGVYFQARKEENEQKFSNQAAFFQNST